MSQVCTNIAALTALPRDEWARIRKTHFYDGVNKKCIKAIEKAIFVVNLSSENLGSLSEKGKFLLHGDGKTFWFDKCANVLFFQNGHCGLNLEHSLADAPTMGHCWEYAMTKEYVVSRFIFAYTSNFFYTFRINRMTSATCNLIVRT